MVEGINISHRPVCVVYIVSLGGVGRDSSVGIATRYGLDGPGIESCWGQDVPHLSRPGHSASCTMGTESFSRDKAAGAWR